MPRHRDAYGVVLFAALFVGLARSSGAQCPESRVSVKFGGVAHYDLPAGWMDAQTSEDLISQADVWVVDDFEITDLPQSTTIACTIRLILAGSLAASNRPYHYSGGRAEAGIKISQSSEPDSVLFFADNGAPEERSIDTVLDLPVILTTGSPFRLEFHLQAFTELANTGSYLRGDIRFVGLPEQAGVRSCMGYVLPPVSVELQTWTRIKQLYRDPRR